MSGGPNPSGDDVVVWPQAVGGDGSINPNFYPISSVAMDGSDASGNTAFVSIMGFTGGPGHVWQTTNASAWTDFTGTGSGALPDSPVNALLVDASTHTLYAGTDVGVFQTSTVAPGWSEVGPAPGASGVLPNVAVTALALFDFAGQKLLRAATYGRGIWQFDIFSTPGFQITVPVTTQTTFAGQTAFFAATLTAFGSFEDLVTMSCASGSTAPPQSCVATPASVTPTVSGAATALAAGGLAGNYNFNLHAAGTDSNHVTHDVPITLQILSFGLTLPSPNSTTVFLGASSAPVNFQATAGGSFNQVVTVICQLPSALPGSTCTLTPATPVNPISTSPVAMTATLAVPASTPTGTYTVTLEADTAGEPAPQTTTFTAVVVPNPATTFLLSGPGSLSATPGNSAQASLTLTSQALYSGQINASCDVSSLTGAQCSLAPANPIALSSGGTANLTASINVPNDALPGTYTVNLRGQDVMGSPVSSLPIALTVVEDYTIGTISPASAAIAAGGSAPYNLSVIPVGTSYNGTIHFNCIIAPVFTGTCTFNPATVTPGSSAQSVVMTVSTIATTASTQPQAPASLWLYAGWLLVPAFAFSGFSRRARHRRKRAALWLLLTWVGFATLSCGGSSTINKGNQGTNPGVYAVTVTGSPASGSQPGGSATVLTVD